MGSQMLIDFSEGPEDGEVTDDRSGRASPNGHEANEGEGEDRAMEDTSSICNNISALRLAEQQGAVPVPTTSTFGSASVLPRKQGLVPFRLNATALERHKLNGISTNVLPVTPPAPSPAPTRAVLPAFKLTAQSLGGESLGTTTEEVHSTSSHAKTSTAQQLTTVNGVNDNDGSNGNTHTTTHENGASMRQERRYNDTIRLLQRYEERQKDVYEAMGHDLRRRLRADLLDLQDCDYSQTPYLGTANVKQHHAYRRSHPIAGLAHTARGLCAAITKLDEEDRNLIDRGEWDRKAEHYQTAIMQITSGLLRNLKENDLGPRASVSTARSYRPSYAARQRSRSRSRSPARSSGTESIGRDRGPPLLYDPEKAATMTLNTSRVSEHRATNGNGHAPGTHKLPSKPAAPKRSHPRALLRYNEDMEWDAPAF